MVKASAINSGDTAWMIVATVLVNLLAGSLPGIWIGTHLSAKVPEHVLRRLLGAMLLLIGSKLVFS